MQVACPKCDTEFMLDEEQLPDEGRTLVCSACSTEWHYDPIKAAKEKIRKGRDRSDIKNLVSDIQSDEVEKEIVKHNRFAGVKLFGKLAVIIGLAVLTFYQWHKLKNKEPDLKIVRSFIANKSLELEIVNNTHTRVKTRTIDVTFYNEQDKVIRKYKFTPEANSIFPNSSYTASIPVIAGAVRVEAEL